LPPLEAAQPLIAANLRTFAQSPLAILGRSLPVVRKEARDAILAAARSYFAAAGDPLPETQGNGLILAGHQPELFHPGVLIKNFAINALARRHGAIAVNLIVDNDAAKPPAIKVPVAADPDGRVAGHQAAALLPFDLSGPEIPYEDRQVKDENLFASLPAKAAPLFQRWGFQPLLNRYWADVIKCGKRTAIMGERFAGARRLLERDWGCHNWEIPLGAVSQTEPFSWFFADIFANVARFHRIHNTCLAEYRRHYGLQSRSHPVPDLAIEAGWLEMPFWAWRPGQPQRVRVFAKRDEAQAALRIGNEVVPASQPADAESCTLGVGLWREASQRGFKIRTRALTTTLFARMFLSDLFVHGIGGAKYDEVTDEIIRRYYEMDPPAFLVLSGTLLLPLPLHAARPEDERRLTTLVRDYQWNPQRHLPANSPTKALQLAAEKDALIQQNPPRGRERRVRFKKLQSVTDALRVFVRDKQLCLEEELARSRLDGQENNIWLNREYAFCLFPEGKLRAFCTQFQAGQES
jgi:hypothetical protein